LKFTGLVSEPETPPTVGAVAGDAEVEEENSGD
jgi:hypothetical protein